MGVLGLTCLIHSLHDRNELNRTKSHGKSSQNDQVLSEKKSFIRSVWRMTHWFLLEGIDGCSFLQPKTFEPSLPFVEISSG